MRIFLLITSQIVEKWSVSIIRPLLNKIWRMAAVRTNSMRRFDQQVSLFRLLQCVSVTGFPSIRREEDSQVVFTGFRKSVPSTGPLHCPPQRQNTDLESAEKQGNVSEDRGGVGWLKRSWNVSTVYLRFNKSQWFCVISNKHPLILFIISNLHKTRCKKKNKQKEQRQEYFLLADAAFVQTLLWRH